MDEVYHQYEFILLHFKALIVFSYISLRLYHGSTLSTIVADIDLPQMGPNAPPSPNYKICLSLGSITELINNFHEIFVFLTILLSLW